MYPEGAIVFKKTGSGNPELSLSCAEIGLGYWGFPMMH